MTATDIRYYLETLGFTYDVDYEMATGSTDNSNCRFYYDFETSDSIPYNRRASRILSKTTCIIDRNRLHIGMSSSYDLDAIDIKELLRVVDSLFTDNAWMDYFEKEIYNKYQSHRSNFESEIRDYKINRILEE